MKVTKKGAIIKITIDTNNFVESFSISPVTNNHRKISPANAAV